MNTFDTPSAFNALLASSIHDMKNSLGLVINSLELFSKDSGQPLDNKQASLLQFEARRINDNLIKLLALYKSENNLLSVNIDEHDIDEFLEEVVAQESSITAAKGIKLTTECDNGLIGYFDIGLITGVLGNALHNAIRHTKDSIHLVAQGNKDKSLVIKVIDNGPGINAALTPYISPAAGTINHVSGGTGLGLHFCNIVARLHANRNKQGYISIENREDASGAVFTIYLP